MTAQLILITYKSWLEVPVIIKESVWETTKEISRRYTELAKKNETPHTTSCKRFARLREELTKIKIIPLDKTKSIKDDDIAQVLGKEHRGRVRGLGLGVTPTRVQAVVIGKTTIMQLQAEMKDLRDLVKELQIAFNNQSPIGVSTSEKDASPQKSTKYKLLHWVGNGQKVAEAQIDCIDPQALVHHKLLGSDYWRVCVKKIMVSDVPLIRDTSEL
ncbi:hypothetical protein Ddye_011111 [Dipteronia dyeriana]|uniref:Transposase Tnp1/En/Spm-like domain-containing protein n=1 Tax=Dipteronia dyeriana TaxID=168575 RepID=A0AAE0CNY6_9ROSI|nr:hypothetical protein Ddye_011111 [Dipteronia dyeriana]